MTTDDQRFAFAPDDDELDPMTLSAPELRAALLRWAMGDYAAEAAVAVVAGFGCPPGFWLRRPTFLDHCVQVRAQESVHHGPVVALAELNGERLASLLDRGAVSASRGELHVLHVVAGLLGHATRLPLSQQLTGLDGDTTALLLDALAHTGGWHEHGRVFQVRGTVGDVSARRPGASVTARMALEEG